MFKRLAASISPFIFPALTGFAAQVAAFLTLPISFTACLACGVAAASVCGIAQKALDFEFGDYFRRSESSTLGATAAVAFIGMLPIGAGLGTAAKVNDYWRNKMRGEIPEAQQMKPENIKPFTSHAEKVAVNTTGISPQPARP